jgi:hypothetical protein
VGCTRHKKSDRMRQKKEAQNEDAQPQVPHSSDLALLISPE